MTIRWLILLAISIIGWDVVSSQCTGDQTIVGGNLTLNKGDVIVEGCNTSVCTMLHGIMNPPCNFGLISKPIKLYGDIEFSLNGNQFGLSAAIYNDTIISSACGETVGGHQSAGVLYIFKKDARKLWVRTRLELPTPHAFDYLGHSLDIHGDRIVASSFLPTPRINVFERFYRSWNLTAIIQTSGESIGFAESVSLSVDRMAIGDTYMARVYIFTLQSGLWVQTALIIPAPPVPMLMMDFGTALSLCGDFLAISAQPNMVYIFRFNGTVWNQIQFIQSSLLSDRFGSFGQYSLKLDGYRLVVGSAGAMVNISGVSGSSGLAYYYVWNGSIFELHQIIRSPRQNSGANCGSSVSIHSDTLIMGCQSNFIGTNIGSAEIFRLDEWGVWQWQYQLIQEAEDIKSQFNVGACVGTYDDVIFSSAPAENVNSQGDGAIYLAGCGN